MHYTRSQKSRDPKRREVARVWAVPRLQPCWLSKNLGSQVIFQIPVLRSAGITSLAGKTERAVEYQKDQKRLEIETYRVFRRQRQRGAVAELGEIETSWFFKIQLWLTNLPKTITTINSGWPNYWCLFVYYLSNKINT